MFQSNTQESDGMLILAGVVIVVSVIAAASRALGIDFTVMAAALGWSAAVAAVVLVGGGYLSGSWMPGPARLAALAAGGWAAWIPAMTNRAEKIAGIDPTVGPMPYNDPLPVYGQAWFQLGGLTALVMVMAYLAFQAHEERY